MVADGGGLLDEFVGVDGAHILRHDVGYLDDSLLLRFKLRDRLFLGHRPPILRLAGLGRFLLLGDAGPVGHILMEQVPALYGIDVAHELGRVPFRVG